MIRGNYHVKKTILFIQIPCLNEEQTLPAVIADLPREIDGIDEIYTLVIDDGSTDRTVEVAKKLGVDYIIENGRNLGLAKSFNRGIEVALSLGADIIVNTDGDNQYDGSCIAALVKKVLEMQADVVIGCRDIDGSKEFSSTKKILQKIGSYVVRRLSGTDIPDTTSGFRAVNRTAAIKLSIMSDFSYTLEMLIQARRVGLKTDWVPIRTNSRMRESRLFKSIPGFISQQLQIVTKVYLFYHPVRFFGWLAFLFFSVSTLLALRIAYFMWLVDPGMHKFKEGSGTLLLFTSIVTVLFLIAGMLSAVLSGLRFLMLDTRSRLRNIELQHNIDPFDIKIIKAPEFFKWTNSEIKK